MKQKLSQRGHILAVITVVCLSSSLSYSATTVIGTGPDASYLVLESPNLGVRTYEVHYTYDSGNSQDAYFLLTSVLATDSSLVAVIQGAGNYYLESITYNSVIEKNSDQPPNYSPFWSQWVAGGEAGFPTASPTASGTWDFGSGISAPYRLIAPGSWDALVFSDGSTQPSVSPVPEPAASWLTAAAAFLLFRRRRNS